MIRLAIPISALLLCGCCWWAKRDCFSPCPVAQMVPTPVEVPCKLPPDIVVTKFRTTRKGCPEALICLDRKNAASLAQRLTAQRTWISEARARCGAPAATSRPAAP